MVNHVLFKSSIFLGIAHTIAVLYWKVHLSDPLLVTVYMVGVATSLVNHGLTSELYKWADRGWMALGCFTDLVYIMTLLADWHKVAAVVLQFSYIGAFFLAKWLVAARGMKHAGNIPHICTHAGATVLHVWLLYCRHLMHEAGL